MVQYLRLSSVEKGLANTLLWSSSQREGLEDCFEDCLCWDSMKGHEAKRGKGGRKCLEPKTVIMLTLYINRSPNITALSIPFHGILDRPDRLVKQPSYVRQVSPTWDRLFCWLFQSLSLTFNKKKRCFFKHSSHLKWRGELCHGAYCQNKNQTCNLFTYMQSFQFMSRQTKSLCPGKQNREMS